MQIFSCPFCGPRPEAEFHFGGDLGNHRPEPDASDAVWANYLHYRNNPKGAVQEVWMHLTCAEVFALHRDSVTMQAEAGRALTGTDQDGDRT